MMSFSKHSLLSFLSIIFLGAAAPIFAIGETFGEDSEKEMMQARGPEKAGEAYSSFSGASLTELPKLHRFARQRVLGRTTEQAATRFQSAPNSAAENNATANGGQRVDDDQKYQEMVRASGLKEIDRSSKAAQRLNAHMDSFMKSLVHSVFSNSDSDDSEDDVVRAEQRDTQNKLEPDQKNKKCADRLWACLSRIWSAASLVGKGDPALGSMLDRLWD